MIIALKTRKLLIKIGIGEARAGGMWGWEGSCVACNFFGSICMFFFLRFFS